MTARIALAATLFALVLAPATRADDVLIDQLAPMQRLLDRVAERRGLPGRDGGRLHRPAGTQWTIGTVTATGLAYGGNASEPVRVHLPRHAAASPGHAEQVDQTT